MKDNTTVNDFLDDIFLALDRLVLNNDTSKLPKELIEKIKKLRNDIYEYRKEQGGENNERH